MGDFRRYAVYFAPRPASELGRFGAAWFGWDADRGTDCAGIEIAGLPRPRAELVAVPCKYGFHGTLKAPFRLAEAATAADMGATAEDLARRFAAFHVPLGLRALGPFLALAPLGARAELHAVADACVTAFDPLRAPLTSAEIARRRAAGLTPRQDAHLIAWGYPYVFDGFEFHLTLTGPLAPADLAATRDALAPALAPVLAAPTAFEDICVFGEAADGLFHCVSRHALGREAVLR